MDKLIGTDAKSAQDQEVIEYFRQRLSLMEDRYVREFPKWTIRDNAYLGILLQYVYNLEHKLKSIDILYLKTR